MTGILTLAVKEMTTEIEEVIEDRVVELYNDLIQKGEDVRDTGEFKNSFSNIRRLSATWWQISNDAPHAPILFRGRRVVGGKAYGSLKWAAGFAPMKKKFEKDIERLTRAIRV